MNENLAQSSPAGEGWSFSSLVTAFVIGALLCSVPWAVISAMSAAKLNEQERWRPVNALMDNQPREANWHLEKPEKGGHVLRMNVPYGQSEHVLFIEVELDLAEALAAPGHWPSGSGRVRLYPIAPPAPRRE
jgi:hypothetical protein